jgi:hypothetical protein
VITIDNVTATNDRAVTALVAAVVNNTAGDVATHIPALHMPTSQLPPTVQLQFSCATMHAVVVVVVVVVVDVVGVDGVDGPLTDVGVPDCAGGAGDVAVTGTVVEPVVVTVVTDCGAAVTGDVVGVDVDVDVAEVDDATGMKYDTNAT